MGKSSAVLKDARDHIIVGFSKKQGTFESDPSLKDYMDDEMKVVRVTRYLDPMKAKGSRVPGGGLGHEFLVVDLRTPENCQIVIRAEKEFVGLNDEKYPPGGLTNVTRIKNPPEFARENKKGVKYSVDLQGRVKILMKDLIDILKPCNRCYSVWKHNCWEYAYDTLENLLEKFAELADSSDDFKKEIREELYKMPRPLLPVEILQESAVDLTLPFVIIYGPLSYAVVKGLAGSSLFKASVDGATRSLVKRSWAKGISLAAFGIFVLSSAQGFNSMRVKHSR